jgi:hypothetical protein
VDAGEITEIQQLLAFYGHAVDAPEKGWLSEVFTKDAVYDSRPNGGIIRTGLAELQQWFDQGKPPHPPSHNTTNVYVYHEDGEVHVLSKYIAFTAATGQLLSGDYHDIVVKEAGVWRIKRRTTFPRYPIPYTTDHDNLPSDT